MKFLSIFFTFTIFWCDANTFLCRYYDGNLKSLEIYCGHGKQTAPRNCTREIPSSNRLLSVIRLKIEGCYQSDDINTENSDFFDVSYSGDRSVDWSIDASESIIDFDASFNQLNAVPKAILRKHPKLEYIDLSFNSVMRIYDGDFKNGRKLQDIDLSHNLLEFIDANAFANLIDLNFINLQDNQFVSLPVFNNLYASTINIEGNLLLSTFDCLSISTQHKSALFVRISWEYIKSFYGDSNCNKWKFNIQKMYDMNGVHTARPPFDQVDLVCNNKSFKNLQFFVAGRQNFINVNEMLDLLGASVWKIDLTGNRIGELNATTFLRFRFLRELILSDTGLTAIDINVLNHLRYLNRLDLSMNHMKMVDNSILMQYFGHLIDLNVAGNQIENADQLIRYLPPKVQRLNLSGNNMSSGNVFNIIDRLMALKYLNLSDTNLSILDENLLKPLRHLVSLDVSRNDLSNVNFGIILNDADQLQEFRASNCQMKNISDIIQYAKPSMQILDLSGNYIGPIEDTSLFQTLTNLTHLNLSATNLHKFDFEIIKPLKSLQTLDISHNHLQSIDLAALPHFAQLDRLYLNDNDLTKLDNFDWTASPNILLALARNHMPCAYLRQLHYEHPNKNYIGDQLNQKHGDDCRSNTQAISDFLGSVYDTVKFW